ncbi:hypothetical protein F2P56_002205 [Juglans regia]|nr:hypothetical protein F2P56_002205 [Juglans regia]
MCDSLVKELGDGFKPKNLTTMTFFNCQFLKKIPDLPSLSSLKELIVRCCRRLVEVHDSVGSLENLSNLDFRGCSKLHILPRSLNLKTLRKLSLRSCSSLRDLPEIECKMESLNYLNLDGTVIEELPLFFGNLVGLKELHLLDCKNLMRLPNIACILLQHLLELNIASCSNLVKNMGNDGLSLLAMESTNSSNGSTALPVPNLQSCFQSESNFFPIYTLFTMFNSSTSLRSLYLGATEIVSLPTSIKEFVTLAHLSLRYCNKLEEILELPPNIRYVDVDGCKSLERFGEV